MKRLANFSSLKKGDLIKCLSGCHHYVAVVSASCKRKDKRNDWISVFVVSSSHSFYRKGQHVWNIRRIDEGRKFWFLK